MHKLVGHFLKREGLYKVNTQHPKSTSVSFKDTSISITNSHCWLGHISLDNVRQLCQDGLITGFTLQQDTEITTCDSCAYAKMTHKPMPKERNSKHADSPGGEVHTDMWGLSPVKSLSGKLYYISFNDDKTHYIWVYLLVHKSNALHTYLLFEAWMKTQHGYRIKCLHSNQGREYLSNKFSNYLTTHRIEC